MYEKVPIGNLTEEEWLTLRRSGIGGSDVGAVVGLNPYSSPMSVFCSKTCKEDGKKEDSEAIRIGHDLEQYVADRFSEATGLKCRRSNYMYRSKEHPFMIADVDRLIVGKDAGLECKTANAFQAGNWKDEEIPPHYLMQCFHYMAVTGKKEWYIACLIMGRGFVYRKVSWDETMIERLIRMEEYFWNEYVVKGCIPDPDGSIACDEVITQYYSSAKSGKSLILTGFDEKLERRQEIQTQIEALELEQKQIDQEVKLLMKDCELAKSEKYFVKWTNVESTRLDTKRLRSERPDIYRDYSNTTKSRRFVVNAA